MEEERRRKCISKLVKKERALFIFIVTWVLNGNIDFPFTNTNGREGNVFQGRRSRGH